MNNKTTNSKMLDFYWNTEEFKMILNLLIETRKKNKLTQTEMAKILKINRTKYCFIESGKQIMSLPFLFDFCQNFGFKLAILEANVGNSNKNQVFATNIQNSTISQKNEKTAAETSVLSAQLQAAETRLQEKDAIINQLTRTNEKLIEILGSRS